MNRIGIFVTHPVQYHVPVWRRLSRIADFNVSVYYFSEQGVSHTLDPGFGKKFAWDIPLLEGYDYTFLSKEPIQDQNKFRIPKPNGLFKKERFNAVLLHGYTHRFSRQVLCARRKFGFRVVLRGEFSDMPRRRKRWKGWVRELYLRWFYRQVDHFCSIGADAQEHLERRKVDPDMTTFTPYSVDDTLFEKRNESLDRIECRKSLDIHDNQVVFLFSGKMIPRKQPLLLAKAALQLKDEDRLVLVFLGDGEQFGDLKKQLDPILKKRFIAPGFINQSELRQYFMAADVFVLPSRYDTWGLVVNEAMHYGLPCIVSDRVGSRRDLVIQEETGHIFPHEDPTALARCMQQFLNDPSLASRLGDKAYEWIQGYTIGKTLEGLESALRKVLQL